ncbi:MAG: hypothetical protein M3459_10205 [Actinomycetota bacterium]|nr:hypothetical protein [Actinomycetota bacterium]
MKPSRDIPDELLGVAEELESHRPQLSGLEADRIKLRAMAHGAKTATRTSTKGTFMRTRLAITSMLAFGLLMTGSGAALGVSALTTTGSAAQAQYGQNQNPQVLSEVAEGDQPGGPTLGGGGGGEVAGASAGGGEVAGASAGGGEVAGDDSAEAPLAAAQAPRQLESAQGAELPFTGYAAIPTLLIGLGLLAMGLILRRNPGRPTA